MPLYGSDMMVGRRIGSWYLGRNVETIYDIVLPDTVNLTNALGVVNHISLIEDISFNKEAPDTINLTNSTLIHNDVSIGSVHLARNYTLSNSKILYNENGSIIGTYIQSGRITLPSGGDVLSNDGTITTMNISDLTATNSSGSTVVYIRNQNGAKITNLNLSGTIAINVTAISNGANTVYVDNNNGFITEKVNGIYNMTGTDPVFVFPVIPSSKFKNSTFGGKLHIVATDIIMTHPMTLIHLTSSVGSSVLDITVDNVNYTGNMSGLTLLLLVDSGVHINSVSINNAKNFSIGINNHGNIDTAIISNSTIKGDPSKHGDGIGIGNYGIIGTAIISNSIITNASTNTYAYADDIYNGGIMGTAIIKDSAFNGAFVCGYHWIKGALTNHIQSSGNTFKNGAKLECN